MRLIDVGSLNWGRCPFNAVSVRRWLDEAHAIDAVPVVRCKDCKKAENREHEVFCSLIGAFMGNDDFCSYGERKDGAT